MNNFEHEYSPSRWTTRFDRDADKVLSNHIEFATIESEQTRAHVKYEQLSYGAGCMETIDMFGIGLSNGLKKLNLFSIFYANKLINRLQNHQLLYTSTAATGSS